MRLRSEHRASSSKGQSRLKDRWCCDPTISSSSHLVPSLLPSRPQCFSNRNSSDAREIERHHYEARTEHEPARPDQIEVERTLEHPQRRDVGLDAERNS